MARLEITRKTNRVHNPEVQECTHEDLYEAAQREIAEHHTEAAINFYRQREWDDEQHRIAKENGANQL